MTYPLGEDPLDGKPCEKCPDYATNCAVGCDREGDGHDSDCSTHNAPAYPKEKCDCSPVTHLDLLAMARRVQMMSECRDTISRRSLAEVAVLVERAADTIKNLEIALRIKFGGTEGEL